MIFLLIFFLLAYLTKEFKPIGLPFLLIYSFALFYAFPFLLLIFGAILLAIIVQYGINN